MKPPDANPIPRALHQLVPWPLLIPDLFFTPGSAAPAQSNTRSSTWLTKSPRTDSAHKQLLEEMLPHPQVPHGACLHPPSTAVTWS